MTSTTPTIQVHHLTNDKNDSTIKHVLKTLRPHFPFSLPLYRRLQFGRFFESTTLLTNLESLDDGVRHAEDEWLITFVDRSCRPETEVWLFASWEGRETLPAQNALDEQRNLDLHKTQDSLLLSLVRAIKSLGPPPRSMHQDILDQAATSTILSAKSDNPHRQQGLHSTNDDMPDPSGVSRNDYTAHMLNHNLVLFGAIHSSTTEVLVRNSLIKHVFDSGLVPNWTYVFDIDALPEEIVERDLPSGLVWGQLQREHLALVRNRTQIPRQERTLAILPNVAVFEEGSSRAIAWCFVGLDGSLTTLHVEEEWRGIGLAGAVAARLWRTRMGRFWEGDEREQGGKRLAHDYVGSGNDASRKVGERLGGRWYADTFWARIDLERAIL